MLALGQTLWIILILYADSLLPLQCEAAIENKQMKMGDKDNPYNFASKLKRRLLDWRDDTTDFSNHSNFTNNSNTTYVIFVVIFAVLVFLLALIKCCMKLAQNADDRDDYNSNAIVHPPPRNHFIPSQRTYTSRPLAPPMTHSRSLILLPEGGIFQPFHVGIENPNYVPTNSAADPTPSYASIQPKNNNNPTSSSDLPPSYDTVVIEEMLKNADTVVAAQSRSTSTVLPKYDDSRY